MNTGDVLVIGGGGMLGLALQRLLGRRQVAFVAPARSELDIGATRDLDAAVAVLRPSAVINASAYSDVGAAEQDQNRNEVFRVNREGPGALALVCRHLGVPLVHVSTDFVFDGEQTRPYNEGDATGPLQVYGQSKLEGEIAVRQLYPASLVVRTSTLYGPGPRVRPHYVDAILRQARKTDQVKVVRPPVSSPTYTPDLARALLDLLEVRAAGIVHVANAGGCSRLDLARATVRLAGLERKVRVLEVPEPEGGLERPAYSELSTALYSRLSGKSMRSWTDALAEYVAQAEQGAS